jgi:hypothetical protein
LWKTNIRSLPFELFCWDPTGWCYCVMQETAQCIIILRDVYLWNHFESFLPWIWFVTGCSLCSRVQMNFMRSLHSPRFLQASTDSSLTASLRTLGGHNKNEKSPSAKSFKPSI